MKTMSAHCTTAMHRAWKPLLFASKLFWAADKRSFAVTQHVSRSANTAANNFTMTLPIAMGFQVVRRVFPMQNQVLLPSGRNVR